MKKSGKKLQIWTDIEHHSLTFRHKITWDEMTWDDIKCNLSNMTDKVGLNYLHINKRENQSVIRCFPVFLCGGGFEI